MKEPGRLRLSPRLSGEVQERIDALAGKPGKLSSGIRRLVSSDTKMKVLEILLRTGKISLIELTEEFAHIDLSPSSMRYHLGQGIASGLIRQLNDRVTQYTARDSSIALPLLALLQVYHHSIQRCLSTKELKLPFDIKQLSNDMQRNVKILLADLGTLSQQGKDISGRTRMGILSFVARFERISLAELQEGVSPLRIAPKTAKIEALRAVDSGVLGQPKKGEAYYKSLDKKITTILWALGIHYEPAVRRFLAESRI